MNDDTPRLALPLLAVGQAQKEGTHNEALVRLDLTVNAAVEAVGRDVPPDSPEEGQCWIVGAAPTGAWAGQAHALAGWTGGGWRFVAPAAGMQAWDRAAGQIVRYEDPGEWVCGRLAGTQVTIDGVAVVGAQQPAIAVPVGGTSVDTQARDAIAGILEAMRGHGLIAS